MASCDSVCTSCLQYGRRNIHHPYFKNMSRNGAIAHLKDEDVGEFVIRPSSQVGLEGVGYQWGHVVT